MKIKVCDFGLSEFQIDEEMFEKEPKGFVSKSLPPISRSTHCDTNSRGNVFGV